MAIWRAGPPSLRIPSLPGSQPLCWFPGSPLPTSFTNDGAALMTHLPPTDTYNAVNLTIQLAILPSPTLSPGVLVWADLTTFGDIPPFGTAVTTVFTAAAQFNGSVNHSTAGAMNNALAAGWFDEVPITIIGGGQDTDDRVDERQR